MPEPFRQQVNRYASRQEQGDVNVSQVVQSSMRKRLRRPGEFRGYVPDESGREMSTDVLADRGTRPE